MDCIARHMSLLLQIEGIRLSHAVWTASLTILLYDYLLTFNDEVAFLRSVTMARSRVLFVLNRYWAIPNTLICNILLSWHNVSDSLCISTFRYFGYSSVVSHIIIGCILILRIYAMYGCNKVLLIFLAVFLTVEVVTEMLLCVLISADFTVLRIHSIAGCIPGHIPRYSWTYWMPMVLFETTLFTLASTQALRFLVQQGKHAPAIARILLRDSLLYFGNMLALILINLIVWSTENPALFFTFPSSVTVFHSILGCRMLLNMRDAVPEEDEYEDAERADTALTSVLFRRWSMTRSQYAFSLRSSRSGWTEILEDQASRVSRRSTRDNEV